VPYRCQWTQGHPPCRRSGKLRRFFLLTGKWSHGESNPDLYVANVAYSRYTMAPDGPETRFLRRNRVSRRLWILVGQAPSSNTNPTRERGPSLARRVSVSFVDHTARSPAVASNVAIRRRSSSGIGTLLPLL